jgi:hypothetical protein
MIRKGGRRFSFRDKREALARRSCSINGREVAMTAHPEVVAL